MLKWIGAVLVIGGCGTFGFSLAAAHKREESILRALAAALDYMQCELLYRLTPLPELCRQAADQSGGIVAGTLAALSRELEKQISPDVPACMAAALNGQKELPDRAKKAFETLGACLGRFDVDGQIRGLEAVRDLCRRELDGLSRNRENRLRSYQTLGLCAGAALAILFV